MNPTRFIRRALVCFALKEEAAPFQKMIPPEAGVDVLIVGIGRQNAERSVRQFLAAKAPECVFTCGFAGGLTPELRIGEVVYELPDSGCDDGKAALEAKLGAAGAKRVKFFCADRIATSVAEKKKLREETGADAVEMESAAIQAVCRERGIACVTVRVISDTANEDLPLDFNALAKADKSLDFGKLAWAIAKSPGKIGALMELQKKTSLAAGRLAAVLQQVIAS